MMQRFFVPLSTLALAALLLIVGCSSPGETVRVTDRPEPEPEQEELQPRQELRIEMPAGFDTVKTRPHDHGKMWTFDDPPVEYIEDRYDFTPDDEWMEQIKEGALRFGENCSASFVSPHGLVMTNHHCARNAIGQVTQSGENLLQEGYVASRLEDERAVEDLSVRQFVEVEEVTEQIYDPQEEQTRRGRATRAEDRQRRAEELEEELNEAAQEEDPRLRVEVTAQNEGARYAAYTFRVYNDVRLVMAPEMQVGFFGGSPDNFTYPRFNLDVAFLRVYEEGEPVEPSAHFSWNTEGAEEGDAVFAVGNPGNTSRHGAVSQLRFQRDYTLPQELEALRNRQEILRDYIEGRITAVDYPELQNLFFSIENSVKSTEGQLRGLRDPYLIARRTASERELQDAIIATDSLRAQYRDVLREIEQLQRAKEGSVRRSEAFTFFTNPQIGSRVLTRAMFGYFFDTLQRRRAPSEQVENIRQQAVQMRDWPDEVETAFIELRFEEMRDALGEGDPTMRRILGDKTPRERAEQLVEESALTDSSRYVSILDDGYRGSDDVTVPIIESIAPLFFSYSEQRENFRNSERTLVTEIARAREAVFGPRLAPDASFTPRLSDGVIDSYHHNGTRAPAFTNFYGMLDRHFSHQEAAWDLPEIWREPPESFDLSTPLNLVSTNDIAGGSSGSPLLDKDLNVVGVIFDSNTEALPNQFLYTDTTARSISVDGRGILEALSEIYEADHLVQELTEEELVTPAAAR